jgi:hypothetical protein
MSASSPESDVGEDRQADRAGHTKEAGRGLGQAKTKSRARGDEKNASRLRSALQRGPTIISAANPGHLDGSTAGTNALGPRGDQPAGDKLIDNVVLYSVRQQQSLRRAGQVGEHCEGAARRQ